MSGTRAIAIAAVMVVAAACGKKDGAGAPAQDTASRNLTLAPVDSSAALNDAPRPSDATQAEAPAPPPVAAPAPAPPPAAAVKPKPAPPAKPRTPASPPAATPSPAPAPAPAPPPAPVKHEVAAGASITLSAATEFSTKTHKVGQTVKATVTNDVTDENGTVVVPAGSIVTLVITELVVSENKSDEGKVALKATDLAIGDEHVELDGVSTTVDHTLKGRGVQAGDAAKVGAGAAAGAILGRVLGGRKKGAVVGGVIGAAAGTAVAVNSADRDLIVAAGARIVIKLRTALSR